jgi:hypothetical protein
MERYWVDINITGWALDSYLDLKRANVFSEEEFQQIIKPDVLRLLKYPNDAKFSNNKFWSPAAEKSGVIIADGYKMKWHQVGDGKVQLRLTVGLIGNEAYLCEAYVKRDDKFDNRMLARFKVYLKLIRQGQFKIRGKLT